MGIDAIGYFDIEGRKISEAELAEIKKSFEAADYDLVKSYPKLFRLKPDGIVEINFGCDRYYSPQYERGPLLNHITILGWLLRNLPKDARVFFGGDNVSLDNLSQWTLENEREYLDHYLRVGHQPFKAPPHWAR